MEAHMRRNQVLYMLLRFLVAACIFGSALVLVSGRVCLVSGRDYRMLERYAKLETVRAIIEEEYYQEADNEMLMDGAIAGMLSVLDDPYTFYYTPEMMQQRNDQLSGVYHGVGLLLQANDAGEIEVLRVYAGSPAEQAGLLAGDILLKADDVTVSAQDTQAFDEAVARISGEDGTVIRLAVRRNGEILEMDVVRGSVVSSSAEWAMLERGIGYISIFQFGGDAAQVFTEALDALEEQEMRALIIDVRSNPGGTLDDVVAIADEILPEGLIVYMETRKGERDEYYSDGEYCAVPLAVLVNGGSASASEVLAAAVQDHERGAVIGTQTFGKGVVQAVVEFPDDGSGLQYTIAAYYTPGGRSIHESGVTPDLIVEGDALPSLAGNPDVENDAQLQAAIEWLLQAE